MLLTTTQIDSIEDVTKEVSRWQQYIDDKIPVVLNFLLELAIALVILVVGGKIIKWLVRLFHTFLDRKGADASVVQFLSSSLKAGLYFLLIVSLAMQMGLNQASVVAVIGSVGVGLGLALQGGMANLAGGVLILLVKPFRVGDYIVESSSKDEGTVSRIDMFYTTLHTIDNKKIVIPNGKLTNNSVTNITAMDLRQLDLRVGISYEDDLKRAKDVLERLMEQQVKKLDDKDSRVFVDELADSSVVLGCRFWVKTEDYWPVKWEMNEEIKCAFDEAGIKIPYNQLEVHVKK